MLTRLIEAVPPNSIERAGAAAAQPAGGVR